MRLRVRTVCALIGSTLALSACGEEVAPINENSLRAGEEEIRSAQVIQQADPCSGPFVDMTALDYGAHGWTTGFLFVCPNGDIAVIDYEGNAVEEEEQHAQKLVEFAVAQKCNNEVKSITAINHGAHGWTTGFHLVCKDEKQVIINGS